MKDRKFKFTWELLGNIQRGRPNLGPLTRLEMYRLFQYTLRDTLEQQEGTEKTNQIFYQAGKLAGKEFYDHLFPKGQPFNDFIKSLQKTLRDMGVGILRVEESDIDKGLLTLTVSEDLDCSGLPELGYEICTYDEGFIAGVIERHTGKTIKIKEIDCWCTGDRTCRFKVEVLDNHPQ